MKKLLIGLGVAACAGCASDPDATAKTMDFLGTVAAVAIEATTPPPPPPPPQTVIVQQPVVVAQPTIVQQPVIQQPVVVAPQPVVQPPAVQAPAAVAPAVAPVVEAAPPVTAPTTATDTAEPELRYGKLKFVKCATPDQIAAARQKIVAAGKRLDEIGLTFEKGVDEATVAATIAQFPTAKSVACDRVQFTSTAAFAQLRNATSVEICGASNLDVAPLAGLKQLTKLRFSYSRIDDLSPLAGLPALEDIDFYGAQIRDFSPLAACLRLKRVYFYAAKCPPEGYASLGNLKQVKQFHGGLTKMTSIAWVRQVPQAEELKIFSEKIADFTPLQALPNLTYLRCWNMYASNLSLPLGDLAVLANCRKLRKLELPGSSYVNTAALAGLTELEELDLSGAKNPVDVSFAAKLPKLRRINLSATEVVNGATLPASVRVTKNDKTRGL
ncbi:MAG: leucine-rich repeat domain-containing protein [Kiritimatiellia bacterium]